jgi:hypothetical protein
VEEPYCTAAQSKLIEILMPQENNVGERNKICA